MRNALSSAPGLRVPPLPPSRTGCILREKVLAASYPAQVPVIDALVIAANGDLWFREYVVDPEDPVRYVVADSTGRFKAFAIGPTRFTPSWIGADRAIGLWRDQDDVAHLRGYRLTR